MEENRLAKELTKEEIVAFMLQELSRLTDKRENLIAEHGFDYSDIQRTRIETELSHFWLVCQELGIV